MSPEELATHITDGKADTIYDRSANDDGGGNCDTGTYDSGCCDGATDRECTRDNSVTTRYFINLGNTKFPHIFLLN